MKEPTLNPPANNSNSHQVTRRRLLGSAAGVAAAAASALMPPNVRRVLAQAPPRQGSLRDIKHVVLLMQENRSFDHYFGTMAGVRGFDDPHALKLPNGKSVFYQPDPETSRRLPAAVSPGHADDERAERFRRPATPGPCSTRPGTAARWTTGCRRIARPMGRKVPT